MEIRELDPHDDEALRAWYDVYLAAEATGREFHTGYAFEEIRGSFRTPSVGTRDVPVVAVSGGTVVSASTLTLPLLDNLTTAQVKVRVSPGHHRRGIGSAVLEHLTGLAAQAGRTVLMGEVASPWEGPADGTGHASAEFARAHGFSFALGEVQRVLDLPVDELRLRELEERAAPRHHGYTFRDVTLPLPEDLVLPVGGIRASLEVEAPTGELEIEREYVDQERVRSQERTWIAMGRQVFTTLAFAPDGSLAGYTELAVAEHDLPWIYQWGTLVERAHRGHALGLALKVRSTRWVQGLFPRKRGIRTWNAESNRWMVAVNDALGYRPVERLGEWQKLLARGA